MIRFVALRWQVEDPVADHRARDVEAGLLAIGWHCPVSRPGWRLWCERRPGRWMLHAIEDGHVLVVGRVFDRRATESGSVADAALPDHCAFFGLMCTRLVESTWGGYVALRADPARPERLEILREPMGSVECATWTCDGVRIATSRPEAILGRAPPKPFGIDWTRLADIMRRPVIVADQIALDGIDTIPPGTLARFDGAERADRCLWSPAAFSQPLRQDGDPAALPALVDACTGAWTSCSRVAIAELSGGLDSAMVASGIIAHAHQPARAWFHYHASDPRSDERRFARLVAERLGLPLEEIFRPDAPIGPGDVETLPVGLRPGFGSANIVHDADLARRGTELGADMLLTGNGGDALFFQDPSPWIAADLRRLPARLRDKAALLARLATWTGASIWSLAAIAAGLRQAPLDLPARDCTFLADGLPGIADPIPWLAGSEALPPAKRLQILSLAVTRSSFNPSCCADAISVVHPLLSQPLLERVLPIPAIRLTDACRDRAMIRAAYAGRLPPALLDRHGKGLLTAHYGRRLAASTDFLRDYLLGGVLAAQRVIDVRRLEPLLDPEHLMRNDPYAGLLLALMAERWARAWSERCRPGTSAPSPRPLAAA
jgi:asparagine synthase (glutamine-hydrolysing)